MVRLPDGTETSIVAIEEPRQVDEQIQSWDCAFKDLSTSDYVVGQVWARWGAIFLLGDQVRGRMDCPATVKAVRGLIRWPCPRSAWRWPRAISESDASMSAEGFLRVDEPLLTEQRTQECGERLLVSERSAGSEEDQLVLAKSAPQSRHALSAKDLAQNFHRQEEVVRRADPASMIRGQSAAGHHAVHVGMRLQGLAPRMENAQETDLSPEAQKNARFLVETTVYPQLVELAQIIHDPGRPWYKRVVDLTKDAPEIAAAFFSMPPHLAVAKLFASMARALADYRDDQIAAEKRAQNGLY